MSTARSDAGVIDLTAALSFIDALAGGDTPVTFQTFPERTQCDARPSMKHGTLVKHATALSRANQSGAGVFLTINETNLRGRKASDVTKVRAVFADFDGVPLPQSFPLTPHIVVESSPGKWHTYWRCAIPLAEFKGVQHSIAQRFGSDPAVCDLPRVMRLPGFLHQKHEPFCTRIERLESFPAYSDDEILVAFPPVAQALEKTPSRIGEGQRNSELFKLASLWHRQGRDREFIHTNLTKHNVTRCDPPLDAPELEGIAHRAVVLPRHEKLLKPLAHMDTPEYLELSHSARALLVEAERFARLQGNGNVALTYSLLKKRGFSEGTIATGIRALLAAGFIERTREPIYGQQGATKACALYRVRYL